MKLIMLRYRIEILSLVILLAWQQPTLSQQNEDIVQYSLEDGLPSRQILGIASDDDGFLWLATANGVSRFDGYDFLNFDKTNTVGLTGQHILTMSISDSVLWLGTFSGITAFNLNTYQASQIPGDFGEVSYLYVDSNRSLWFMDYWGNVHTMVGQEIRKVQTHYNHPWMTAELNHVTSFGEDDHGVWWGRLDGSIYRFLHQSSSLELMLDGNSLKNRGKPILVSDSTMITFSMNEISQYNSKDKTRIIISDQVKGRGKISILAEPGLLVYIDATNNVYEILLSTNKVTHNQQLTDAMSGTAGVNQLLVKNNVWWIATNVGLIKLKRRTHLFRRLLKDKSISVRSIHAYQQGKWLISTYQGLYHLDQDYQVTYWSDYPYRVIHDYFEDRNGTLWVVEEGNGLMKLDSSMRELKNVLIEDDTLSYQSAIRYQDKIYIGSYSGVYQFDMNLEKITMVQDSISGIDLSRDAIFDLLIEEDKLWIGAETGLYQLDLTNGSLQSIDNLNNVSIRDIHSTKDGTLWLGTGSRGLIEYQPATKEMRIYDQNRGLSNNTINLILSSHQKKVLWVGTNIGLSCIDRASGRIINYYEDDGIAHNEFNRKAGATDSNGNIWMGGLDGITVFDPGKFTFGATNLPELLLTGVGKFDGNSEEIQFDAGMITKQRVFRYGTKDRLFRFRFALSDFDNLKKNKFRYKIEGLHHEWVDLSTQHELLIDNLSPGEHTLKIAGTNGSGVWSSPLILNLHVDYAYYQLPWFYLLVIIGLIMIGVLIHKIRIAQILKIERVRTKIARDLHDELGSSLTRISMYSEIAKEKSDSKDTLDQVAILSRDAASTLSDIVWSIDNTDDSLGSLLDRIKDHLFFMIGDSHLEPKFSSKNIQEDLVLAANIKQNVFLISKEAINNSVKYSNGKELKVNVLLKGGKLIMQISDDGTKEPVNQARVLKGGNGLKNMAKRAEQMGGDLQIDQEIGFSVLLTVRI